MRQIDKMSKDEILDFLQRCEDRACETCPAHEFRSDGTTSTCVAHYLEMELPAKRLPRWATIKSDTDMETMLDTFNRKCVSYPTCGKCPYYNVEKDCRALFFCEEVEVFE